MNQGRVLESHKSFDKMFILMGSNRKGAGLDGLNHILMTTNYRLRQVNDS